MNRDTPGKSEQERKRAAAAIEAALDAVLDGS